jgi:preprotein translocase subunit SecF
MRHLIVESNLRGRQRFISRSAGKSSTEVMLWLAALAMIAVMAGLLYVAFRYAWSGGY